MEKVDGDDDYSGDDVYVPAVVKVAISSLSIPPPSDSKGLCSAFWMCLGCASSSDPQSDLTGWK